MSRKVTRLMGDAALAAAELFLSGIVLSAMGENEDAILFHVPMAFLWFLETAMLLYAEISYIRMLQRKQYTLSSESIKEGYDNLPDGGCFFDEHGAVRLINREMLSVGIMLFGKEIQTLDELHTALQHPPDTVKRLDEEILLYRFPDGIVRRFTEHTTVEQDGRRVTEVVATDVTELYAKQMELNKENARLAAVNGKMKKILDNMSELVREKEILTMKMRVHDDIGHSILSARKALLEQEDITSIRESAEVWEKTIDQLDRANHMPAVPDEWETVQNRARDLGIEIELDGELPDRDDLRHLLILSVRECMTNCVRHAGGNMLFVTLTYGKKEDGERELTCVITNNGTVPDQTVMEGGGLSGLRRRIEREGGTMRLQSTPCFALIVTLREENPE